MKFLWVMINLWKDHVSLPSLQIFSLWKLIHAVTVCMSVCVLAQFYTLHILTFPSALSFFLIISGSDLKKMCCEMRSERLYAICMYVIALFTSKAFLHLMYIIKFHEDNYNNMKKKLSVATIWLLLVITHVYF